VPEEFFSERVLDSRMRSRLASSSFTSSQTQQRRAIGETRRLHGDRRNRAVPLSRAGRTIEFDIGTGFNSRPAHNTVKIVSYSSLTSRNGEVHKVLEIFPPLYEVTVLQSIRPSSTRGATHNEHNT
jgi:hypothetical protein